MLKHTAYLAAVSALMMTGAGAAYAQQTDAQPAAAAPAPAQAAAPAPVEPPPVLPTTGDGAQVVKLLSDVCRPLIEGRGQFEALVTSAGMTKVKNSEDNEYILKLDPRRPYQIAMRPPSQANRNVCELRVRYAPGWQGPIIEGLNVWRFLHAPQLHLQRNEQYNETAANNLAALATRTVNTWDNYENQGFDGFVFGLVMTQLRNADGTPRNPQFDEALIQYARRPALASFVAQANAYKEAVRQQELQQQQQQQQQQQAVPEGAAVAPTAPAT